MPRLFFAIDLPDSHRIALGAVRRDIWDARWVKPERLHLTVRFVGSVDEPMADALVDRLSELPTRTGEVTVEGVGVFGSRRRPRVLWAGVRVDARIDALQAAVENSVQRVGLPGAEKSWTPHITLARFRHGRPEWLDTALQRHSDLHLPPFRPSAITLYESKPGSGPAEYVSRGQLALG